MQNCMHIVIYLSRKEMKNGKINVNDAFTYTIFTIKAEKIYNRYRKRSNIYLFEERGESNLYSNKS